MRRRMTIRTFMLLIAALTVPWSSAAVADTVGEVRSTRDALVNTAAILEGRVTEHAYTFDPAAGPRTVATLSDVVTHFGRFRGKTLKAATLGGPVSERRWLFIPELPRLTAETRYLVFLTNVEWFYTPVVGNYIFRLEPGPNGSDVLIDPSGHAIVGVSAAGLELSRDPVVDTQIDLLTPHAKLRLLETAARPLAEAMPKEVFLSTLRELLKAVPLHGGVRTDPAGDRLWNVGIVARDATPHSAPSDSPDGTNERR